MSSQFDGRYALPMNDDFLLFFFIRPEMHQFYSKRNVLWFDLLSCFFFSFASFVSTQLTTIPSNGNFLFHAKNYFNCTDFLCTDKSATFIFRFCVCCAYELC